MHWNHWLFESFGGGGGLKRGAQISVQIVAHRYFSNKFFYASLQDDDDDDDGKNDDDDGDKDDDGDDDNDDDFNFSDADDDDDDDDDDAFEFHQM